MMNKVVYNMTAPVYVRNIICHHKYWHTSVAKQLLQCKNDGFCVSSCKFCNE